jgi:hypothetical protein
MNLEEFKELSSEDDITFRKWARDNYKALDPIKGVWHPSIQDECNKINQELLANYGQRLADSGHTLTQPTLQQLIEKIDALREHLKNPNQ